MTLYRDLKAAEVRMTDLAAELAELEASTGENPDDEHDPDGSTVGFERARVSGLLARATTDADDLRAARDRLDAGTYGHCGACGQPIPAERLEALPSTTVCVACAGWDGEGTTKADRVRARGPAR